MTPSPLCTAAAREYLMSIAEHEEDEPDMICDFCMEEGHRSTCCPQAWAEAREYNAECKREERI